MAVLSGFGITAFGIAPLAPDAAKLPQRLVTQVVSTEGVAAQVEALAAQPLSLWRGDVSRANDSPQALLRRLGVVDVAAAAFLRSDATARKLFVGRSKMLQARTAQDGSLLELVARYPAENSEQAKTHFTRLSLARDGQRFTSRVETVALAAQVRMGSGSIRSSLFAATDEARLPDAVASQLAEIFATDIDFHRELRKGDSFSVVYEAPTADGEPITWGDGTGRVLGAEFINKGKVHHALWFSGSSERAGYFELNGRSKRRAFLASPMEFSRVTSGFAARFHPILQKWRAHLGVDYGAPAGTAVRTVGDGVVEFAGWQNGYGKVVEIKHGSERSTLYAHLSAMNVAVGQRVEQGQTIGVVGTTGWSTGPHLHFEFRVKGEHQDPLLVAQASEALQLDASARERFATVAKLLQAKLGIAQTLGSGRPE